MLEQGGFPASLLHAVSALTCDHVAFLSLSGRVFAGILFQAEYSQGNPLSVWIYILAVDPFLRAASRLLGVQAMSGFCDDWTLSFDGMDTAQALTRLIHTFKTASGQSINRIKSV